MKFSAHVLNREGSHQITLKTGDASHSIDIPPKSSGFGSSANGFLTKLAPGGNTLRYSTFLGQGDTIIRAVAVNAKKEALV